jgi:sarcosine oxidase subunit alpha
VLLRARVIETHGARALQRIIVRTEKGRLTSLPADTLAMSGGWNPNIAVATHLGGRPVWSDVLSAFVPGDVPCGLAVVGAARGSLGLADALREGTAAGFEAAVATGFRATPSRPPPSDDEPTSVSALWFIAESKGKAFVDYQHDVTRADIALAEREGFDSVELLKRYTTLGMGTDQGKTANVNGLAILASLAGRSIPEVGATVFRPPCTPVAISAFAGPQRGTHFMPTRFTSSHQWAQERGATFVEAGPWLRAQWFALPGENDWLETVAREVRAVRTSVGVCDVSTLGKIDIQGPDAGVFLDRIYINSFSTLPVGKVRYGLMLREDGFVFDDGTSARLTTDHYLMSTTTANAAKVMQHLEYARQVLWPELDVQLVSVTEQWAQYAIAGPNARRLLERLLGDAIDVSTDAFPHLACADFCWSGIPARLFRISFSGELAFELAVPARYGDGAIRALMGAGEDWNVVPYGTEALGVMRIEKGHVAGNELNGMTTASDLGFGRLMSTRKNFIGRVLATRTGLTDPNRHALVGVKPLERGVRLYAGAHFLSLGSDVALKNDEGYLASVAFSPMLESWIGLGFLARGSRRRGERVRAYDPLRESDVEVEVVSPVFFDPDGLRLHS